MIAALSCSLLLTENGFHRRTDIQTNTIVAHIADQPDPFTQQSQQSKQLMRLVVAQTVQIAPKGAGYLQACQVEKNANHL